MGSITISGAGTSTIVDPYGKGNTGFTLDNANKYTLQNMQINVGYSGVASDGLTTVRASNGDITLSSCTLMVPANATGNLYTITSSGFANIQLGASVVEGPGNTITILAPSVIAAITSNGGSLSLNQNLAINGNGSTALGAVANIFNGGKFNRNSALLPAISGTMTGPRYVGALNSVIQTVGGGANFFLGTLAGSLSSGAQYA